MRKIEFKTKDGKKGQKFVLEPKDKVTAKYNTPKATKLGKYMNYSLGIEGKNPYVQLTKAQYEKIVAAGDVAGKIIEAYEYENDFGKQVGVKIL